MIPPRDNYCDCRKQKKPRCKHAVRNHSSLTVHFDILKFEKHNLNPDPGHKQKNQHLRKSVTKPRGKAESWTVRIQAERQSEENYESVKKIALVVV